MRSPRCAAQSRRLPPCCAEKLRSSEYARTDCGERPPNSLVEYGLGAQRVASDETGNQHAFSRAGEASCSCCAHAMRLLTKAMIRERATAEIGGAAKTAAATSASVSSPAPLSSTAEYVCAMVSCADSHSRATCALSSGVTPAAASLISRCTTSSTTKKPITEWHSSMNSSARAPRTGDNARSDSSASSTSSCASRVAVYCA
mmetsp:Transcript_13980/g.37532  ORF Transcript_13980/g.37532 Transcript_13980/m.37532 type:complete len:202 (+) Transcript_13980:129-734(+)